MKILVTGATGFLGTHVVTRLRANGHEVMALSSKTGSLTESKTLTKFAAQKFDQIFHLAAWTQAGDFCVKHPGEQWIINQQINTNVLSFWQQFQPQAKMIAIGTSCCYEPGKPHTEEHFMRGDPTESLYTYAMTKRMLFAGLMALAKQFGMQYLFVVPSTLYGPNYHLDGRQMHFIFDVMRKIVDGKEKGTPVELWGDGSQVRELVYVDDFIDAMLDLNQHHSNEIVNIGEGRGHTIREFADALCSIIGYDSKLIRYDTSKYVGAQEKVLDISKLRQLIPQWKQRSLADGLKETVAWYREKTLS